MSVLIILVVLTSFGVAALQEWNCTDEAFQLPIQYMRCYNRPGMTPSCHPGFESGAAGHGIFALDLSGEKGEYKSLFTIPRTMGNLADNDLNGCGISPVDSFAYCIINTLSSNQTSKTRLIRFGSAQPNPSNAVFEYVAILPSTTFNTAGFDADGNFHMLDPNFSNKMYVMGGANRPDKLVGVAAVSSCKWSRSEAGWESKGRIDGLFTLPEARKECIENHRVGDKTCKDVFCMLYDTTCSTRKRVITSKSDPESGLTYTGNSKQFTYSYDPKCLDMQPFDDPNLVDLSQGALTPVDLQHTAHFADVGFVKGKFEPGGNDEFYGILLGSSPNAVITVYRSPLSEKGVKWWTIQTRKVGGVLTKNGWGAAWIYKNHFYASNNRGDGKLSSSFMVVGLHSVRSHCDFLTSFPGCNQGVRSQFVCGMLSSQFISVPLHAIKSHDRCI